MAVSSFSPFRTGCCVKLSTDTDTKRETRIGLALSGGGFRAMAFHLGCMRALQDRGLLERVDVLSTISGGSVIGAMWAYSDDDFATFDVRVQNELRRGYKWRIVGKTLFSLETPLILGSLLTSGFLAALCSVGHIFLTCLRFFGVPSRRLRTARAAVRAPLPRFASRTTAFVRYLDGALFRSAMMKGVKRSNLEVVINATELRTQSAFRYGSTESGCWRFGLLVEDTPVARAVAASAAYPVFLPALDGTLRFEKDGAKSAHRTIISDGGTYDNLGTSCLIPERDPAFSTNVMEVDFIIACVAGQGIPDGSSVPYFWASRMIGTVSTTHRRTHSLTFDLLHRLERTGAIKGFVLPYLGQEDEKLPCRPPDLVPRNAVFDYPTDFDSMRQEDIDLISKRGEQLTRNLIETYYPSL